MPSHATACLLGPACAQTHEYFLLSLLYSYDMGLFSCLSPLIPRSRSSAADSLLSEKHARGLSSSDSNDHAVREQHRHDIDSERKLTAMRDEIKKADLDV